jgi:hypothetical protein
MNRSSLLISTCLLAIAAASCSGSSKKLDLGGHCVQNSDCNNPLACKFQACHTQCKESRDCLVAGEQCVAAEDGVGVCQTAKEAACGANGTACLSPLVCVSDTCVNVCPNGACLLATKTCNSDGVCVEKLDLGGQCIQNSDCNNPLACKFATCHQQCVQSRDCPTGQQCVAADDGSGVCQTPVEAACSANGQACASPLVCVNSTCVNACTSTGTCTLPHQTCIGGTVCVDNTELAGNDGSAGAGGGTDAGSVADGAAGGSGDASPGIDAPAPAIDSRADVTVDGPPAAAACTGKVPSYFGQVATSDSDSHYTSGVGVLTATEFLTFNGYVGPDSTDGGVADGGAAAVNRIDVQHFDPITGKSKGNATAPFMAAGDGSGLYINGAAVAPTGEIAIIYSAATGGGGWDKYGVYLAFLDKDLALSRTMPFVAFGSDNYQDQSHVQWLNGNFVASATVSKAGRTIKLGKFGADGSNAGGISAIPTDDPSGYVDGYDVGQGEVAFSGGQFAVAYLNAASELPYLTILDTQGTEIGVPLPLPSAVTRGALGGGFASVAGTTQGFVAVYNGTSPSTKAASLLATFVSNSGSGDAGVSGSGDAGMAPIGATYAFTGGYAFPGFWSAGGSSDGTGAGFAVLYPDGSVSFLYFSGDGSTHPSPQAVFTQAHEAGNGDEARITNFAGNFAVSLYSSAEHLTRMAASGCRQ